MSWTMHALGLLAVISAVVFAAGVARPSPAPSGGPLPTVPLACLPIGFVATALWLLLGAQPATATGQLAMVLAAMAAFALWRPGRHLPVALAGGAAAALWSGVLHAAGLPTPIALLLAVAVLAAATGLSLRSPDLAPPAMLQEAQLMILGLGILVVVGPAVSDAWRTAVVLNSTPTPGGKVVPELWVMLLLGTATCLGSAVNLVKRR